MNYTVDTTRKFDKALKKCIKRGLDLSKFKEVVKILSTTGTLPAKYKPHKLMMRVRDKKRPKKVEEAVSK